MIEFFVRRNARQRAFLLVFGGGEKDLRTSDLQLKGEWANRLDALEATLKRCAPEAERQHKLMPEAVTAMREQGVDALFLASSLGGAEVDPVTCALITERIARVDTAAAWFVMVANAPKLMAASWPQALVERLWGDTPHTLIAASGHTMLDGRIEDDNLVLNGKVGFSSGCHHADYIGAPARLTNSSAGAQTKGAAQRCMALVPAELVSIEDDWQVTGMRGTGSNSVVLDEVIIPRSLTAPIAAQLHVANPYYSGVLYRCPGRILFSTYVPISLAVAGRALDELDKLARVKTPAASSGLLRERQIAQLKFGKALAIYRAARRYFYDTLNEVWERALAGEVATDEHRAELYLAGTHGVQASAEVVRLVADAAGTSAIYEHGELARLVRDMEVLRHHGFASENRYASVAQQMWGSTLDYPLLLR